MLLVGAGRGVRRAASGRPDGLRGSSGQQLRRCSLSQAIPVVQPETGRGGPGPPAAGTPARSHQAHPPEQVPPSALWVAAPGSGTWPPSEAPRGASGQSAGGGCLGCSHFTGPSAPGAQPRQARRVTGPRPALALGLSVSTSGRRGQLASFRATCCLSGHGGAPVGGSRAASHVCTTRLAWR